MRVRQTSAGYWSTRWIGSAGLVVTAGPSRARRGASLAESCCPNGENGILVHIQTADSRRQTADGRRQTADHRQQQCVPCRAMCVFVDIAEGGWEEVCARNVESRIRTDNVA